MRFEILGPLRLVKDSNVVNLGSVKRRILLAMLLTNLGESVATQALVEAMWGAAQLDTARNTLHWHVHQLRKALGDAGRVAMRDGGYRLNAEPAEVDVHRFHKLYREGAAAAAAGKPEQAARLLAEADEQWRGAAFADLLSSVPLRTESERLAELRFAAMELRCESELRLGRHETLVPLLSGLVADFPFREGLRGRLMLALYRSGRQAESLRVFREGRERSIDELGIEPGPELVRLERAILKQDPALDPPQPAPAPVSAPARPATAVVPAELPADLVAFTGRGTEVAELRDWLGGNSGPAAIVGTGGVGKSTLAVHVAHLSAADFPDGSLYVNLHGATPDARPLDPADVLARFLRSLGQDPGGMGEDLGELSARFRTATADKRLLILLDDAHSTSQVRPLLPGGPRCRVLITSRGPVSTLVNVRHWHLDVMTSREAMSMLVQRVGRRRVDAESEAAAELVRLCGRFPLALSLAAARLSGHPHLLISAYVDRLAREDDRLAELAVDDQAVRACFEVSFRDLAADDPTGRAAELFRLLGLDSGSDIGVDAVAALAGVDTVGAGRLLDVLTDTMLIDNHAPGRYRMHDLLRLYARQCADAELPDQVRTDALRRIHHFYLGSARDAVRLLHPQRRWRTETGPRQLHRLGIEFADKQAAASWFDGELPNLLAATRQAAELPDWDPGIAVGLAITLNSRLSIQGRPREQLALTTIAVTAAAAGGNGDDYAVALYDHGESMEFRGDEEQAKVLMTQALEQCEAGGDLLLKGRILKALGYVHNVLGDLDTAIDYLQQGLDIHKAMGNHMGVAHGLVVLGVIHRSAGRHDQSIAAQRDAVAILDTYGEPSTQALIRGNLAEAYLAAGQPEAAMAEFSTALQTGRGADLSGTRFEAGHLWGIGEAKLALGDTDAARERFRESAAILFRLNAIDESQRDAIGDDPAPPKPTILVS